MEKKNGREQKKSAQGKEKKNENISMRLIGELSTVKSGLPFGQFPGVQVELYIYIYTLLPGKNVWQVYFIHAIGVGLRKLPHEYRTLRVSWRRKKSIKKKKVQRKLEKYTVYPQKDKTKQRERDTHITVTRNTKEDKTSKDIFFLF